ncbi:MAG: sigma factor-like helix-turn-helix DNA-binding protein [Desulfobulbus sp.]|jgi:RNA polymerase sigma-70 factor (ECF subfamily)
MAGTMIKVYIVDPNQRLAIVLRYYENLGYEEIASALETTTKAVERLLARGRERLRDMLGRPENFFDYGPGVFLPSFV